MAWHGMVWYGMVSYRIVWEGMEFVVTAFYAGLQGGSN